jgi:methionine-rich copper-binding protein CopC
VKKLAVPLAMLAMFAATSPGQAHAALVKSEPAAGAELSESPASINLTFDDDLSQKSSIELSDESFNPMPLGAPRLDGPNLSADVATDLAPGTYTVQWTAVTLDGHQTQGSFQFAALNAPPSTTPALFVAVFLPVLLLLGIGLSRKQGGG